MKRRLSCRTGSAMTGSLEAELSSVAVGAFGQTVSVGVLAWRTVNALRRSRARGGLARVACPATSRASGGDLTHSASGAHWCARIGVVSWLAVRALGGASKGILSRVAFHAWPPVNGVFARAAGTASSRSGSRGGSRSTRGALGQTVGRRVSVLWALGAISGARGGLHLALRARVAHFHARLCSVLAYGAGSGGGGALVRRAAWVSRAAVDGTDISGILASHTVVTSGGGQFVGVLTRNTLVALGGTWQRCVLTL